MIRVGVTGGIGSGKTTVCKLLERTGVPVYYSDARAREIMNGGGDCGAGGASGTDCGGAVGAIGAGSVGTGGGAVVDFGDVRRRIVELLGEEAYRGGVLDRACVAAKVFVDKSLLARLDAIVHPAVAADFEAWARLHGGSPYVVLESAVLMESGFDRFVDRVVAVSAPVEMRIERVLERGGCEGRDDVVHRMANQLTDAEREERAWLTVRNDGGMDALAFEVLRLDERLRKLAAE